MNVTLRDTDVEFETRNNITDQDIMVNETTRGKLADQRESRLGTIEKILMGIAGLNAVLFGLLFDGTPKSGHAIEIAGIISLIVGMYAVRMHRVKLHQIECDGLKIEDWYRQNGITVVVGLFESDQKLSWRTIPMMAFSAMSFIWTGVLLFL